MAERSNAHDSKSCDAGMYPRVQIPFSAPNEYNPNLKPILVGGAFGLFLFYKLIQMTSLFYYAIIAIWK